MNCETDAGQQNGIVYQESGVLVSGILQSAAALGRQGNVEELAGRLPQGCFGASGSLAQQGFAAVIEAVHGGWMPIGRRR